MGLLAACSSTSSTGSATASTSCTYSGVQSQLYSKGVLTIATDNPVYDPWFSNNQPSNGKGYESAVAYAVAEQLGFKANQVTWVTEPFNSVYAPGTKKFDFDINEVSYSAARAQAVTFSESYFDVQQAIVALKGSAIAAKHTAAELKTYLYGDQIGTSSLDYINNRIQPTQTPKIYDTLAAVQQALQNKQIEALITDTPTAQYMASSQIKNGDLVAQFPAAGEYYGLVLEKNNPLVGCVNTALAALKSNGTLKKLQTKYLQAYLSVPTIQP
jgi:polar amino acid transport system substrate-binding protein